MMLLMSCIEMLFDGFFHFVYFSEKFWAIENVDTTLTVDEEISLPVEAW